MDSVEVLENKLTYLKSMRDYDLNELIDIQNELAWQLRLINRDRAYNLADKAIASSLKYPVYNTGWANGLCIKADLEKDNNPRNALKNANQALLVSNDIKDETLSFKINLVLASIYIFLGNYENAFKFEIKALKSAEILQNSLFLVMAKHDLALIYSRTGNMKIAIENMLEVLKLSEEIDFFDGVCYATTNIGELYCQDKQFKLAQTFIDKSIALLKDKDLVDLKLGILLTQADMFFDLEEYKKASESYKQLYENNELEINPKIVYAKLGYSKTQYELGKLEIALGILLEAKTLFGEIEDLEGQLECTKLQSKIMESNGDFHAALDLRKEYENLFLIFHKIESSKQLNNYKIIYETDQIKRKAELAETATKAKSDFLSNMSHEIRTPMNAIIGFTELLYNEENDLEKKNKLELIKTSGKNLLSLINDILDFSKIEAGKILLEKIIFNLKTTLNYIYSMYKSKASSKGLNFIINIGESIPLSVVGAEHRIIQILTNIVGNAIKFTKDGTITIDCSYNAGKAIIKITDTGIGIANDKLDLVFSAFNQVDSSTEREFGGTGLGLTISRQLTELMNGNLTITSTFGIGSSFILELPLPEKKEGPGNSQSAAHLNRNPEADEWDTVTNNQIITRYKILVAEDNKINQILTRELLKGLDLECDIAENGKIALEMLNDKPYDLLLLDMQMPVMDGLETLRHINYEKKFEKLYIIALTANAMEGDAEKYMKAGCNDYLSKPIDRVLFQQKIYNLYSL